MKHETKLTQAQIDALGLTQDQIRFCTEQPFPVSGRIVGNDSPLLDECAEIRARTLCLNRFQRHNRGGRAVWTNKRCAEFFGVSPSIWARWLSEDNIPPAVVCFKASLVMSRYSSK